LIFLPVQLTFFTHTKLAGMNISSYMSDYERRISGRLEFWGTAPIPVAGPPLASNRCNVLQKKSEGDQMKE
jgi:hypothetical protein